MTLCPWRAQTHPTRLRSPKETPVALETHSSGPNQAIAAPYPGSLGGAWGQMRNGPYLRIARRTDGIRSLPSSRFQPGGPLQGAPDIPMACNLALTLGWVN